MNDTVKLSKYEKLLFLNKILNLLNNWVIDSSCYYEDLFICIELELIYEYETRERITKSDLKIMFPELFQFDKINYEYSAWGKFDVFTGEDLKYTDQRNKNRIEILKLTIEKINSK